MNVKEPEFFFVCCCCLFVSEKMDYFDNSNVQLSMTPLVSFSPPLLC